MTPIEEPLPTSRELRATVAGLTSQLTGAAQRGDHYAYGQAQAELRAAKTDLAAAERREMNEAAEAHRLKTARTQSGMDTDGTFKSQGYDSPGAMIADMIKRGPVTVQVEQYLRKAGITPPAA